MTINRFLPAWAHRIANGAMALATMVFVGSWVWLRWAAVPVVGFLGKLLVFASIPAALFAMLRNPKRFTLVEGLAGDAGYDELEDCKAGAKNGRVA